MDEAMVQEVVDRAVSIATRMAMNRRPVERILWIPSSLASQHYLGSFAVQECRPLSASERGPWEVT
jgi:hypothetical protein